MTEEDTFQALRRTSFDKMITLCCEGSFLSPQKIVKMWANCHKNIVTWHGPSEEWAQIYKSHGWTFDELIEEAANRDE